MEEYKGVKFKVIEIKEALVKEDEIKEKKQELLELDKMIVEYIKPEKNEGNLSVRAEKGNGFFIKKAGSKMTELTEKDIVFVEKVEGDYVYCFGGIPSSESIMHYEIYKNRKKAKMILHFHDDELMKKKNLGITEIEFFEYGTHYLAEAVGKVSKDTDVIKIRKHGFVVAAKEKGELKVEIMKLYGRLGLW